MISRTSSSLPNGPVIRPHWDPVVKITHWAVVAAVIANALFTEEGSAPHIWVGYALATVLAARLLWGFIGPAEARFTAFPPSPRRAIHHIHEIREGRKQAHSSHNPLGALMVYAIWSALAVIITSGIMMAGPPPTTWSDHPGKQQKERLTRPEARGHADNAEGEDGGPDKENPVRKVHETAVNLLYVLIILHLGGVIFETKRSGRDIIFAMLPCRRGR